MANSKPQLIDGHVNARDRYDLDLGSRTISGNRHMGRWRKMAHCKIQSRKPNFHWHICDIMGLRKVTVAQNKDELLKAISSNFDKLLKELDSIPLARVDERRMEGHAKGTQMSVSNLVAYLVGWNELVLKWLDKDAAGEPIDFPEAGFKWNELGKLAQKFYRDYEGLPYAQLLERFVAAKNRIVSLIESRDDATLYGRRWYTKWTMGRMIQFNTASPYTNARGRLRKWLKETNLSQKS